jgi:hypothetical protein
MKRQVKDRCQALLRRWGYELRRVRRTRPDILAQTGADAPFYLTYETPHPVFAPWLGDPEFQRLYEGIAPLTAGSPERGYLLMRLAQHAVHLPGDFAECGVYQGGTALLLCRIMQGTRKTLYLFDSFQGLPPPHPAHDPPLFREGQFTTAVAVVKQRLSSFHQFTAVREGWIPKTFQGLEHHQYAFVHVDVDFYQSALDCCAYFYPRLTPGGILLFDEYGWPSTHGEKLAVDEYFADKPERPIGLITGQALVLKVPPP